MDPQRYLQAPIDRVSAERMANAGFEYRRVDDSDAEIDAWELACSRGFHDAAPDPEEDKAKRRRERLRTRRNVGVWRPGETVPVATTNSWVGPLAIPGGSLEMWAVSGVTVSPTVAGKGIARALLEGELRTAASLGVPAAGLTVSESTLYGRYGFGIATLAAALEIDCTRVRWRGPEVMGEVEYVDITTGTEIITALHQRDVPTAPGEFPSDEWVWKLSLGLDEASSEAARQRRFIVVREEGEPVAAAAYRLKAPDDYTQHTLTVDEQVAVTDSGSAALWRFLLHQPLVRTVKAGLMPIDHPVRWWVGDWRGVDTKVIDHEWLRILSMPNALAARHFNASGELVLHVSDDLGFIDGSWHLRVDAQGRAAVERLGDRVIAAAGSGPSSPVLSGGGNAPALSLSASSLASLWLGTFSASALGAAALIEGDTESLALADRMFMSARAPRLSTWY